MRSEDHWILQRLSRQCTFFQISNKSGLRLVPSTLSSRLMKALKLRSSLARKFKDRILDLTLKASIDTLLSLLLTYTKCLNKCSGAFLRKQHCSNTKQKPHTRLYVQIPPIRLPCDANLGQLLKYLQLSY